MLRRRALVLSFPHYRKYSSSTAEPRKVQRLSNTTIETFREQAFTPGTPALLPPESFKTLPAVHKWFETDDQDRLALKRSYLSRFGATVVPLEISNEEQFSRIEQPLGYFLECVHASDSTFVTRPHRFFSAYVPGARPVRKIRASNDFFSLKAPTARIYLAQASIADLPQQLRDDIPTPELVRKSGKGDVYDSSIWLGQAPTYTPLHRDPNPNLFVQLAGRKVVRLFPPEIGRSIFAQVQEEIGGSASPAMRGEEMMQGREKAALGQKVWAGDGGNEFTPLAWESDLNSGDGLFIPKGWWHSVKGIGEGMNGSVNWWFR